MGSAKDLGVACRFQGPGPRLVRRELVVHVHAVLEIITRLRTKP